jgi:hypothetical protein
VNIYINKQYNLEPWGKRYLRRSLKIRYENITDHIACVGNIDVDECQ